MKKPLLHFAHGNGFPSLCYSQLLDVLGTEYTCTYVDKVGHTKDYPVTDSWDYLVAEVIESIEAKADAPVIGVGHSLGGVLTCIAAIKKPSLFRHVVMIDSPLLNWLESNIVRIAKAIGIIDRLTPAFRTRVRRQHWHTREELMAYLKTRDLFKTFTDACLEDYINYGTKQDSHGYTLVFDRQVEYSIYRTMPHRFHQYAGQLKVPTALIYADKSTVVPLKTVHYMHKQFGIAGYKMKGTHMLPMEDPVGVGEKIIEILGYSE